MTLKERAKQAYQEAMALRVEDESLAESEAKALHSEKVGKILDSIPQKVSDAVLYRYPEIFLAQYNLVSFYPESNIDGKVFDYVNVKPRIGSEVALLLKELDNEGIVPHLQYGDSEDCVDIYLELENLI